MASFVVSLGNYHVAPFVMDVLKSVTWISAIICMSIFIIALNSAFHVNNDDKITLKSVRWFSLLSLLSFALCLFGQGGVQMFRDNTMQVAADKWYILLIVCVPLATWTLGELFMYLLFMSNLRYTFDDTIFRVSRPTFIMLTILIILFVILRFLYILFYVAYYVSWITNGYFSYRAAIIVSLTEIIDFIISVHLLYLFVNRLFKLYVITVQHSQNNNNNANNAGFMNQIDYKQMSILSVASKYSILSFMAIFSTQLFLIGAVNNDFSFYVPHSTWYIEGYIVYCCLLSFNCIVNSICICLNLEVNTNYYYLICSWCHNCCYKCCIGISKRFASQKHEQRKFTITSASKTDLGTDGKRGLISTMDSDKQIIINRDPSINSTKSKNSTYYNSSLYHAIDNLPTDFQTPTDAYRKM